MFARKLKGDECDENSRKNVVIHVKLPSMRTTGTSRYEV